MMMTTVMGPEMSYLNAQSHAFHPLFNVGEHDMILSIFLTNFSFRTFDTVDFLLLCVRSVSMMFTVYHNNPFLSFSSNCIFSETE